VHALARLAHGRIGESDDRERWQARPDVDLDGYVARIETVDRECVCAGENGVWAAVDRDREQPTLGRA
jgi:hypothetical protein